MSAPLQNCAKFSDNSKGAALMTALLCYEWFYDKLVFDIGRSGCFFAWHLFAPCLCWFAFWRHRFVAVPDQVHPAEQHWKLQSCFVSWRRQIIIATRQRPTSGSIILTAFAAVSYGKRSAGGDGWQLASVYWRDANHQAGLDSFLFFPCILIASIRSQPRYFNPLFKCSTPHFCLVTGFQSRLQAVCHCCYCWSTIHPAGS